MDCICTKSSAQLDLTYLHSLLLPDVKIFFLTLFNTEIGLQVWIILQCLCNALTQLEKIIMVRLLLVKKS